MTITEDEQIKHFKRVKKVEKRVKSIEKWVVLAAWMTIGIMLFMLFAIPPAHAYYTGGSPVVGTWSSADYHFYGRFLNVSEQTAFCNAKGYTMTSLPNRQRITEYNADDSYRTMMTWQDYSAPTMAVDAWWGIHYAECKFYENSTAVFVQRGYAYRTGSEWPQKTMFFTAIPQSGNVSLSVLFTPNVLGGNTSADKDKLVKVVWDYDGGLGVEEKFSEMNTSFIKTYNTAGYYISRATAYYKDGSILTASKNIDVYNYNVSNGTVVTPTPTLTPTPTPTPQTNNQSTTWKVTGYDIGNNTPISGLSIGIIDVDDVGSGWFNVTAAQGSYVFPGYGTGGNKAFVVGHSYMFSLSKTGYATKLTSAHSYDGTYNDYGYYLDLSANVPSAVSFTLQVPLYSTSAGQLSGTTTGTVVISNQSSAWTSTVSNPQAGLPIFAGLTPGASYKIDVNLEGYKSYTGYFASSSSMGGTTQYYYVYLEPTNLLPSAYTLLVTPTSGTLNDTYTLTLSGDISTANAISYKYQTEQSALLSFAASSGYTNYAKVGGAWKGWDGSAFNVVTSNPASVTGKVQSASNPYVDTLTVTAYITVNGNVYQASDTVNLVSQGKEPKIIVAYDMSSGGGGSVATFYGYTYHILDVYTNTWTNGTVTVDNVGNSYYYVTPNTLYSYYGSASGYYDTAPATKTFIGNSGEGGFEFRFYKITSAPTVDNATLYAHVRNRDGKDIVSARVSFNDGQKCYTNNAGSCGVYALVGGQYTATASAYGYTSATGSIIVSNTSANTIELLLLPASTYSNTSVTPGGNYFTPKPTLTFSNTSGLTNSTWTTEYTCNTDTADMGIFDILMNNVACAGVKGATQQGFVLSGLLMFIFAMGLSRFAKGLGALAGSIIGAVVSFGIGILPFWILIVIIIIMGLLFARMLTNAGGTP